MKKKDNRLSFYCNCISIIDWLLLEVENKWEQERERGTGRKKYPFWRKHARATPISFEFYDSHPRVCVFNCDIQCIKFYSLNSFCCFQCFVTVYILRIMVHFHWRMSSWQRACLAIKSTHLNFEYGVLTTFHR